MRPIVTVPLLLLGTALVVAGCTSADEEGFDTVSFTAEDAARFSEILDQIESGQQAGEENGIPEVRVGQTQSGVVTTVALDASQAHRFDAVRARAGADAKDVFRVTNPFLNVRSTPSVQGAKVEELGKGDRLKLLSFPNATWAEIELPDGRRGFVNTSYIAQVVTEETLPIVKKAYEGQYEVNFAFLNVRATPSSQGQKLGELSAHQIIRPLAIEGEWARVPFEEPASAGASAGRKEGFVASQYLKPFAPNVLVRQDRFTLPILRYRGDEGEIGGVLVRHLAFLKSLGKSIITLRDFAALLQEQEGRDVRLGSDAILLTFSDVTASSLQEIADALRATGVRGTFFIRTSDIGPQGIAPQLIQALTAAGNDVQSAGHGGEDLRSLTNSQVALDLAQSRQVLEDLTREDIFAIAYPGSGVNDRIAEQALEAGYLFGLTLSPSPDGQFDRSQFLRLPGNLVSSSMTDQTLKALVGAGN